MSLIDRRRRARPRHGDRDVEADLLAPDAALAAALEEAVPRGVGARASDRLSFADASHYLLVPKAVVAPPDPAQVAALLRVGAARGVALTFRSGGTSLFGQATADRELMDRAALPRDRGPRRRRAGAGAARRDGPRRERSAGPVRPQARARPGERVGVHDRRRRRQLQRHGLRHRAQHLPGAGLGRARAAAAARGACLQPHQEGST